jgi:hypothetical protein
MSFKGLNIDREFINSHVSDFVSQNELVLVSNNIVDGGLKQRLLFRQDDANDTLIELLFKVNGTTTIHYKLGKNQKQGESFAQYLYKTIDASEFESVNFSLRNLCADDVDSVIETLSECLSDNGAAEFKIEVEDVEIQKCFRISSVHFQDSLVVTHYKTTDCLLIQGRPLYCYRKLTYLLAELLDLSGIQNVIARTDSNIASVASIDDAKEYLKGKLVESYDVLPVIIKDLLVSSCCVKLSSPTLPEYSMLLFPDLRALEGALKVKLVGYGLYADDEDYGIGTFFDISKNVISLDKKYHDKITDGEKMIQYLESGYTFLRTHRNSLFHMNDFVESSRKIDTLDKALSLSDDSYIVINDLFKA